MNWPAFEAVLAVVLEDLVVEKAIIAEEIIGQNMRTYETITQQIRYFELVSHEAFKQQTKQAKVIIRTGETTPYANIILQSGVIFVLIISFLKSI